MSEIAFYVMAEIDPAQRDAFDRGLAAHAAETLAEEEGCLAFDVYVDTTNPNRYLWYEVYADEAAFEVHRNAPLIERSRTTLDPAMTSRSVWFRGQEIASERRRPAND